MSHNDSTPGTFVACVGCYVGLLVLLAALVMAPRIQAARPWPARAAASLAAWCSALVSRIDTTSLRGSSDFGRPVRGVMPSSLATTGVVALDDLCDYDKCMPASSSTRPCVFSFGGYQR